MHSKQSRLVLIATLVAIVATFVFLGGVMADEAKHGFIGAGKCKTCHKKPEVGEQFKLWSESAHAGAYATLASEAAKKIATEKGIEDAQKADECLQCHVTGHGAAAEMLGPKYDITEGVGCESCHGGGADYYKKKTMKAITMGEMKGAEVGLVTPTKETCVGCHNDKSPTFTAFDYDKMVAKIAHPMPDALKAEYKAAGDSE